MNTERLYEILAKLETEVARIELIQKLDLLVEHIGKQVGDPSNATHQQNFSNAKKELAAAIANSWLSRLTPLEAEILGLMDLTYLIGGRLPRRLNVLMRENGMLPAVVRDEFSSITEQIKSKLNTARQTKKNLHNLGFASEQLSPGVGELAYRIPRKAIDNRYSTFLKDAEFYEAFVKNMTEIVIGTTPELELQGLSSSAYSIFLSIDPQVVAFIILAIERVMNGYKTVLEVRVLRDQLKSRSVPEEALEKLEQNITERIEVVFREALDSAIEEIEVRAKRERLNELRNHGAIMLRQLIERMEDGYEIDARVGYSEDAIEDEEQSAENEANKNIDSKVRKSIEAVRKLLGEAKNLNAIEHSPADDEDAADEEPE